MFDHIALLYLAVKREGSYTDWDFSRSLFFLTAGLMSLRGNRSAEYNHQSHDTMQSHDQVKCRRPLGLHEVLHSVEPQLQELPLQTYQVVGLQG